MAFTDNDLCADCEYSEGLGYVPGEECYEFFQASIFHLLQRL